MCYIKDYRCEYRDPSLTSGSSSSFNIVCDLISDASPRQITVFEDAAKMVKREELERTINILRSRYGNKVIQRAVMYTDSLLSGVDAKKDNVIHPVGVFTGGVSVTWGGYTTSIAAPSP